jgi:hypothetical protein
MSGTAHVEAQYRPAPVEESHVTDILQSTYLTQTDAISDTEIITGEVTMEQVDPSQVMRMNLNTGEVQLGDEVVVPANTTSRNSAGLCSIDDSMDSSCLTKGYCEQVKVQPPDVIESARQTFSFWHSVVHSSMKPEFDPRNVLCNVEPSRLNDDLVREGLHTIEAYFQHMFDGAHNTYETTGPFVPEIQQFKAKYGDKQGIGTNINFFDYRTKVTGFMSMYSIGKEQSAGETLFFKQAGAENPFCFELRYTNDEGNEFVFLFYAAKNILPQKVGFAFTPQKDINEPLDTARSRSLGFEVQYDDANKEGRILMRTPFPGEAPLPPGGFDLFIPWIQQFWPFESSSFVDPAKMIKLASKYADLFGLSDEERNELYENATTFVQERNKNVTSQIVRF